MGPDCRERHGFNEPAGEATRREVNRRVFALALWRQQAEGAPTTTEAAAHLVAIREAGFTRLFDVLVKRLCKVTVASVDTETMVVSTPFSDEFLRAARVLRLRWDGTLKRWSFPSSLRRDVYAVLKRSYPSSLGVGPRGPFPI